MFNKIHFENNTRVNPLNWCHVITCVIDLRTFTVLVQCLYEGSELGESMSEFAHILGVVFRSLGSIKWWLCRTPPYMVQVFKVIINKSLPEVTFVTSDVWFNIDTDVYFLMLAYYPRVKYTILFTNSEAQREKFCCTFTSCVDEKQNLILLTLIYYKVFLISLQRWR